MLDPPSPMAARPAAGTRGGGGGGGGRGGYPGLPPGSQGGRPCSPQGWRRPWSPQAAALSPSFTRAPFGSRLGAAATATSTSSSPDDKPFVVLSNWWLVRVEGDEQKIAVAGFTEGERNQAVEVFTSAPIAKRDDADTLEDEDGVDVLIYGPLNNRRTHENGFSLEICEQFINGFPYWWKTWYSHIGSQSSSSSTSNSRVGSTPFYLEQLNKFLRSVGPSFIENLLKNDRRFSTEDSYLPNETPRFEDYTIPTTEKSVASNDCSKGSAVVFKEVDSMETDMIVSSTSQEIDHVDIGSNVSLAPTEECTGDVSLAPTEECTGDETSNEAGNQNDIMHPDAREQHAGSHLVNFDLICNRSPDHMLSFLEDGNTIAGSSVDMLSSYLPAVVPPKRATCCSATAGALENFSPLSMSHQRTPVASLKNQGYLQRTQQITLNQKVVPNENMSTSVHSDVRSLETTVGPAEQRCSHEVLQLQSPARSPMIRSLIPYLLVAYYLLAGEVVTNAAGEPELLCSGHGLDFVEASTDATELWEVWLGLLDESVVKLVPKEKAGVMSVQVHHSPLTRAKAKSLSISTPESLKLRRTKSGRLVVPALDPGCQRIVYGSNGSVSGVAGVALQSPLKGSKPETPARKRRAR